MHSSAPSLTDMHASSRPAETRRTQQHQLYVGLTAKRLRPVFVVSCDPSSIRCAGMTICFFIMSAKARVAPLGSCSKMASMICRGKTHPAQNGTASTVCQLGPCNDGQQRACHQRACQNCCCCCSTTSPATKAAAAQHTALCQTHSHAGMPARGGPHPRQWSRRSWPALHRRAPAHGGQCCRGRSAGQRTQQRGIRTQGLATRAATVSQRRCRLNRGLGRCCAAGASFKLPAESCLGARSPPKTSCCAVVGRVVLGCAVLGCCCRMRTFVARSWKLV